MTKSKYHSLKQKVVDYYTNPFNYIVPGSGEIDRYNKLSISGTLRPLGDVLELEFLGEGHYADVYAIDEDKALKIVKHEDTGYARFVRAIKGKSNPHFPKIFYQANWGSHEIYILERLNEDHDNDDFRSAVKMIGRGNPFVKCVDKHIEEAAKLLHSERLCTDLHAGNVMFRGTVPVITDPCTD